MTDQSLAPVNQVSAETQQQPKKQRRIAQFRDILGLAAFILAVAGFLGGMLYSIKGDLNAYRAEAAADRRAFEARMDEFRREILRLSERQSRLEGVQEA
ncbi:MAG: hypothetical protein OXU81_15680 [Gammaproteobacteria bacterium]|nr:hypothetical protein [Gammaproteobacteria bacterium]